MYELTVVITDKHIQYGIARNCRACPLALALEDSLNLPDIGVSVEAEVADIYWFPAPDSDFSHALRMVLEYDARLFVDDVDEGKDVEPQTVHLSF